MKRLKQISSTSPWAIVAAYFLFAMLVLPLGDWLIKVVAAADPRWSRLELIKELTVVLVSSALLYGLISRHSASMQQSQLRSRRLLDAIPSPAFLVSRDRRILALNHAGTTHGSEVGDYCWSSIHGMLELPERDRDDYLASGCPSPGTRCRLCQADRAMETGQAQTDEQVLDGRIWQVWWVPVDDNSYLHYLIDTTTIRQNEQALRESESRYRELFNGMSEGFALHEVIYENGCAADYRFLTVNPAFERLTGLHASELIGKTVREVKPDIESFWIERYGQVASGGKSLQFEDYSSAFGKFFHVSAYCSGPGRFACIFSDITAVRSLEEHLRQAQKMESIGMLAGGVAHDFNNILTVILGGCSLLEMSPISDEERLVYVEQIRDAAERAAALTKSLLAFSRKQPIAPSNMDLNLLVDEMSEFIRRLIGETITLQADLCAEDTVVSADRHQLEQVLVNLVANARDAMHHGGTLTLATRVVAGEQIPELKCTDSSEYIAISVIDTGAGLSADSRDKIFEPFFTTKEVGKGTGLGLSMAYGIIRQHDGIITVASPATGGSEFTIYLPRCEGSVVRTAAAGPDNRAEGDELVLLVEDDPDVARVSRQMFEHRGFRVLSAADGEQALQLYVQHKDEIELVVMDVIMPGMNGKQVYERLKQINPAVKVLFVSGYTADVLSKNGVRCEDIAFVAKPVDPVRMFGQIRVLIDSGVAGTV